MYARALGNLYLTRAQRKEALRDFWPTREKLIIAKKILWRTGVISRSYFRLEEGRIFQEFRDNVAKIKTLAHRLDEFERRGFIKISAGKIYYSSGKIKIGEDLVKDSKILFRIISNSINEISHLTGYGEEITSIKVYKECKDLFRVFSREGFEAFKRAKAFERSLHYMGFTPVLDRAAKDMAISKYLFREEKKVFERLSEDEIFEAALEDKIREARRKSIDEIINEFSFGKADFSPLFDSSKKTIDVRLDLKKAYEEEMKEPYQLHYQNYEWSFIISDVHLQAALHRNAFELLRFLWVVKELDGELIINGDFIDTMRAWKLQNILMVKSNKIILEALSKLKKVIYVVGNHDRWVLKFRGEKFLHENISIFEEFTDSKHRIHVEHGDKYSVVLGQDTLLARIFVRILSYFEAKFGPRFTHWLEIIRRSLPPRSFWREKWLNNILKGIDQVVLKLKSNLIIFSHFHFPGDSYEYKELEKRVRDKHPHVKFILLPGWFGREGYAGNVACIGKDKVTKKILISTFLWEYKDIREYLYRYF